MERSEPISACIVAKPAADDSYTTPIQKFTSILQPVVDELYLISGDEAASATQLSEVKAINLGRKSYIGIPYADFFIVQFHIVFHVLKLRSEVDVVYFHKGTMALSLPVVISRLFGVRTCVIKLSDFYTNRDFSKFSRTRIHLVTALQWLSMRFADAVVVFTPGEAQNVPNDTVHVAFSNYIDFDRFDVEVPFHQRKFDVGFVGRFTEVKGIETFSKAATELVDVHPDMEVTIVGDGPLTERIEQIVNDRERIELTGWINNDELPSRYNQIQLLIAPSRSEGLPTVLLEAMGCGVVVVAADVGSVSDVIEHGETGFLLEDASREEIAETFKEISKRDDLEEISRAGRDFVVDRYSRAAAIKRFEEITDMMIQG